MALDWRFQVTAASAPKTMSATEAAPLLAAHLAAQEPAVTVLHTLLCEGLTAYHCPQELVPALSDETAVALALLARAPAAGASLVSAFRSLGGLARTLWALIKPAVVGDPLACLALRVARPDLFAFAAGAHRHLVVHGAPPSWLEAATVPPWVAKPGTQFHADVLAAARAAEIPFVAVAKNPLIALFGDVGVSCLKRDSVLLVLLLFFGFRDYATSIPPSAPPQLQTAFSAPWLRATQTATPSLTTQTATPSLTTTPSTET